MALSTGTITHSLGVAFEDLEFKIIYSPSAGTDTTDYQDVSTFGVSILTGPGSDTIYGQTFQAIDSNSVKLQLGNGGGVFMNSSGVLAAASNFVRFKIIIYKRVFK
jgi:hypothetical protein